MFDTMYGNICKSSPRPWRCFYGGRELENVCDVFSTSVEVFLTSQNPLKNGRFGLLHVRGGVSRNGPLKRGRRRSSPRPWRCFSVRQSNIRFNVVFSTSVEVFLARGQRRQYLRCLLHVRGGVSFWMYNGVAIHESSPRPWRCFLKWLNRLVSGIVFSTSVEVFPTRRSCRKA